jgi:polyferredoxin
MEKIGKPRGLIDYLTLADGERERAGGADLPIWRRIFRPRVILYTVLWAGIGVALLAALMLRTDMTISADPVRNPVYVALSDGSIRNTYELRLRNMTGYDRVFRLSAVSDSPLDLELQGMPGLEVTVPANATLHQRIYLTSAPDSPASTEELVPVTLVAEDTGTGNRASEETVFHGRPR